MEFKIKTLIILLSFTFTGAYMLGGTFALGMTLLTVGVVGLVCLPLVTDYLSK